MDLKILNDMVPLKRLEYTTMSQQTPITLFSTVSLFTEECHIKFCFYPNPPFQERHENFYENFLPVSNSVSATCKLTPLPSTRLLRPSCKETVSYDYTFRLSSSFTFVSLFAGVTRDLKSSISVHTLNIRKKNITSLNCHIWSSCSL